MITPTVPYTADDRALTAEIIPHLEAERARAAGGYYVMFGVLLCTVAAVALALNASPYDYTPAAIAGGIGLVALFYCIWVAQSKQGEFSASFAQWQDERVMKALDPNCDFDARLYIESAEYDRSGLFPDEYNGYAGGNYVHRKVGETEAAGSNLNVTYTWQTTRTESYTDSQGHPQTRTVTESHTITRFSGLLLRFDAAKDFTGAVFIDPRRESHNRGGTTDVLLPSSEFMDRFTVTATQELTAHYLLSPAAIERILAVQARFEQPIHLAYLDGALYLALPGIQLDFGSAPGIFRTVREDSVLATVARCRETLCFLDSLVDGLDLNTRIWTKR